MRFQDSRPYSSQEATAKSRQLSAGKYIGKPIHFCFVQTASVGIPNHAICPETLAVMKCQSRPQTADRPTIKIMI